MNDDLFIQQLKSGRLSQIRSAIESRYVPKKLEAVNALADIISLSNSHLHNLANSIAQQLEEHHKVIVLARLARYGGTAEIRTRAVDELVQIKTQEAQEALIPCTLDLDLAVQSKALIGLAGRKSPKALTLLMDRLEHPESSIFAGQNVDLNEIRRWAIRGLATKGADGAAKLLISHLETPALRASVVSTLKTIDSLEAIKALFELVTADDNNINEQLLLDAVEIIAAFSGKLTKTQSKAYQELLAKAVPIACQKLQRDSFVLVQASKYLDNPQVGPVVRDQLLRRLPHAHEIIRHIGVEPLMKWIKFWDMGHQGQSYLEAMWTQANPEQKTLIIAGLKDAPSTKEEAINHAARFLATHWKEVTEDNQQVLEVIVGTWQSATSKQRRSIEAIVLETGRVFPNKNEWVKSFNERAPRNPHNESWELLDKGFACLPINERVPLLQEHLKSHWNQRLFKDVLQVDTQAAAELLRSHLWKQNEIAATERSWAIVTLGKCGTTNDFEKLADEIAGDSEEYALAAVQAVGAIDPNKGQEVLRDTLNSRKPKAVLAAITELRKVTSRNPATVTALRARAVSEEPNDAIREHAANTLEELKGDLIAGAPSSTEEFEIIKEWVETLAAFEKDEPTCEAIHRLLTDLGDREAPDIRILIAKNIANCCPADQALEIAERETELERRPAVRAAWDSAIDTIKGLPDRGVLQLIERICDEELDRKILLGSWSLSQLLVEEDNYLTALNMQLRRAEMILQDPDALIEQLDSIANLLVDQVFMIEEQDISRFANKYGNQIGAVKNLNRRIYRWAQSLHTMREFVFGPHPKDSSGKMRTGTTPAEAQEAKRIFTSLFKEVVLHLRSKRETNK